MLRTSPVLPALHLFLISTQVSKCADLGTTLFHPTGERNATDECPPCPPCFNCNLPSYKCINDGLCNEFTGQCACEAGFGGDDCSKPLCGALSDGTERPTRPEDSRECDCKRGWGGINCNSCLTDSACDALIPGGLPGTCYHSFTPVVKNYESCSVTNHNIIKQLGPDKKPEVTFTCETASHPSSSNSTGSCAFQFWIGGLESFYCRLTECEFRSRPKSAGLDDTDDLHAFHRCEKVQCECIPGRMLCGQDGSIDLGDFLKKEVKGPGRYECDPEEGCKFQEPAMNGMIKWAFGDDFIALDCEPSECLHKSQIPHPRKPLKPGAGYATSVLVTAFMGFLILLILAVSAVYCIATWNNQAAIQFLHKRRKWGGVGMISCDIGNDGSTSREPLRSEPVSLLFRDLEYSIGGKKLLDKLTGTVRSGNVMAIMGASGAGKSTLLEILADRSKSGRTEGSVYVNGRPLKYVARKYQDMVGFVDQEDNLMGTLTVEETILYSALLRLPRSMTEEEKVARVRETMIELGILDISDQRIGLASPTNRKAQSKRSRNRTWYRCLPCLSRKNSLRPRGAVSTRGGISGGEKRRVSVACELVSSPSIIFLDEPTSGLDAYNAYQVVSSLVTLAKQYNRTIVMTLHQPSSNLFSLIDDLTLLSPKGQMVYHGPVKEAMGHFMSDGTTAMAVSSTIKATNLNLPDLLIDLTMQKQERQKQERLAGIRELQRLALEKRGPSHFAPGPTGSDETQGGESSMRDRNGVGRNSSSAFLEYNPWGPSSSTGAGRMGMNAPVNQDHVGVESDGELLGPGKSDLDSEPSDDDTPDPYLQSVIDHYKASPIAQSIRNEIDAMIVEFNGREREPSESPGLRNHGRDSRFRFWRRKKPYTREISQPGVEDQAAQSLLPPATQTSNPPDELEREKSAGFLTQLRILSDRTLKNLYRNPMLMATHYLSSAVIGVLCGLLFWQVTDDIAGFQNRMGCFFFVCALFGFGCLSSIQTFQADRILFVRERANGYYTPLTYFLSKALFDLIPLRVIPPIILGVFVYPMVGLVQDPVYFFKFMLVLVLFNVTSASIVLVIGIVAADAAVASLVASLVMLFSMLFGGLLLNRESVNSYLAWLQDFSFFNYALEALIVNELKDLRLTEHKYGLEIEVPAAVILSTFGFDSTAFWPDFIKLASLLGGSLLVGYVYLHLIVKERR